MAFIRALFFVVLYLQDAHLFEQVIRAFNR